MAARRGTERRSVERALNGMNLAGKSGDNAAQAPLLSCFQIVPGDALAQVTQQTAQMTEQLNLPLMEQRRTGLGVMVKCGVDRTMLML
jgi:hypothetical protein